MANLNKVMLIGRLTRDPEVRMFASGGKVAKLGFAVNNRRKNPQTGQWEDEPVWLDVEVFNRGESGKQADNVEQYYRKGTQAFIEGHLKLDQWTSQDGQKRQRLVIVADTILNLDPRDGGGRGGYGQAGGGQSYGGGPPQRRSGPPDDSYEPDQSGIEPNPPGAPDQDIPF